MKYAFLEKIKRKKVESLIFFVIILCSAFLLYKWQSSRHATNAPREVKSILVEAEKAKLGTITKRITTNGTLVAHQIVIIKAELEGKIKEILFKQGEKVKKNDLLLKIDDEVYRLQLQEAEAKVKLSKTEYERAEYLLKKDFGTVAARDKALANLKVNEAEMEAAKFRLSQAEIRAPFDGTVGLKNISVGGFAGKNEELLTIVDLNPIYVDFPVSESYGKFLKIGQEVDATIEGTDILPFSGAIIAIDPKADILTHSIQVRAQLPNDTDTLKPGQFARVTVELGKEEGVILIPQIAVEHEGNQDFVFLIMDGIAVKTEVTLGQKEAELVQVLDGVKEGDWVVTVGQLKIGDGAPVRIKNSPIGGGFQRKRAEEHFPDFYKTPKQGSRA